MSKIKVVIVMVLWGSIGVLSRYINISPLLLSFFRAAIAIPVLIVYGAATRPFTLRNTSFKQILPYIFAGVLMGFAWMSLFIGYQSDIASSVIAYNMCPVYVLLLAPLILNEKLRAHQIITVLIAFGGLFLIVLSTLNLSFLSLSGVLWSAASGLMYAFIVIINRKTQTQLSSITVTLIQISAACIVLFPFVLGGGLLQEAATMNLSAVIWLFVLGIVHTGMAYVMYFSSYKKLPALTIGILSYLEPTSAMIFAVLLLGEVLTVFHIAGGLLILGSTMFCVIYENKMSKMAIA
jgi:RarD protein